MVSASRPAARPRSPASRTASGSASAATCSAKPAAGRTRSAAPTTARSPRDTLAPRAEPALLRGEPGSLETPLHSPSPRDPDFRARARRDLSPLFHDLHRENGEASIGVASASVIDHATRLMRFARPRYNRGNPRCHEPGREPSARGRGSASVASPRARRPGGLGVGPRSDGRGGESRRRRDVLITSAPARGHSPRAPSSHLTARG